MEHATRFLNKFNEQRLPARGGEPGGRMEMGLPFENYLQTNAVSSTGLRKALVSPRNYITWLMGEADEDTDYYRVGRACHMMLLEPKLFRERYVIMPKFTGLTKDGRISEKSADAKRQKEEWLAQLPSHALVIAEDELDMMKGMAEAISDHQVAANILKKSANEVSGFCVDPETKLQLKFRPDILFEDSDGLSFFDYKTSSQNTAEMDPVSVAGLCRRLGYEVQLAFYYHCLTIVRGSPPAMAGWIFQEKTIPWQPDVVVCPENLLESGLKKVKHGLKVIAKCLDTGKWPFAQQSARMALMPSRWEEEPLPEFDFGE